MNVLAPDGNPLVAIEIVDLRLGKTLERVNVQGEIYRHVLRADSCLRNVLRSCVERKLLQGPADRYEVQWTSKKRSQEVEES